MERHAIRRCLGACLLGSALAMGCSQTGSRVEEPPPWVAHPYGRPTVYRPAVAQRPVEQPQTTLPKTLPPPDTLPPVAAEAKPATNDTSTKDTSITQTALETPKPSLTEPTPPRKSFVDITAQPCFSHTDDYSSLSGQLQHSRITRGWRLRYASVDEVDPYGGSVTLTDESKLAGMKDGDLVRVHGHLINPEDRTIAPAYQVDSIQAVEKKE